MSDGTRAAGALQTREALLDAGAALAEEHGLAGVSVNMVVARAGVAKGTFYVHFKDRAAFVDAMHARFHGRVQAAVDDAVAGLPPGAGRRFRAAAGGGRGGAARPREISVREFGAGRRLPASRRALKRFLGT